MSDITDEVGRLRGLLNAMKDAFCVIEILVDESDVIRDLRFLDANEAFFVHTGIRDVNGRLASEVFPELEASWYDNFAKVYQSGAPAQFVERSRSLNRWFECSLSRIGPREQRQLTCLFKDVTERKSVEDERELTASQLAKLAAALAESDQHKTEFLATLAHELRNPLAPVRSGLEMINECRHDPDEVARSCEMALGQVEHMVRLVDDLLDISRISLGTVTLQLQATELTQMINSAVARSRELMDQKQQVLELALPHETRTIVVDPIRVSQIISNLLSNAAKYTPDHGIIKLSVKLDEHHLLISVSDNGDGLEKDSLSRIFNMFTQITGDVPRENTGLGIGLTLSQRLVTLHGGTLQGFSDGLGKGSRFDVVIPSTLVATVNEAALPTGASAAGRHVNSVLIVDDNEDAACSLAKLLKRRGYEARVAFTGQSALKSILSEQPDVALIDIGLPDISGLDVAAKLTRLGLHKGMSMIALTGWGTVEDQQRCKDAGFDHHVTKPAATSKIVELLKSIEPEEQAVNSVAGTTVYPSDA